MSKFTKLVDGVEVEVVLSESEAFAFFGVEPPSIVSPDSDSVSASRSLVFELFVDLVGLVAAGVALAVGFFLLTLFAASL